MSKKGIIFDIQRFSINDGPGIRTTIFMKGCSLRCKWCHNPESISPLVQLNHDAKKCTLCGKCIKFVSGKGISIKDNKLNIDFDIHNRNFQLIDVCPNNAYNLYGREYTSKEVIEIVKKDIDYYENSEGGVTFSGGEALNQIDFIKEVAIELKKLNIHITLDISGYDPSNIIFNTINFVDLYLLDYKLTDKESYTLYLEREFDFYKVLDFLRDKNKSTILRCPIIPAVNDNEEHFKEISRISREYGNLIYVDILPYHNMVKNKKFKLCNNHTLFKLPSKDMKEQWRSTLRNFGIKNGVMNGKNI